MIDVTVETFALVVLTAVALWALVVFGVPWVARAKFVRVVSEVRDDVEDAILEGRLPDRSEAWAVLDKIDALLENPELVTIGKLWAFKSAWDETEGVEIRRPSYAELAPEQRKLLHRAEQRVVSAMVDLLVHGSALWFVLDPLRRLHRAALRRRGRPISVQTQPRQLAFFSWYAEDSAVAGHHGSHPPAFV